MGLSELDRLQGRVDHPYVATLGTHGKEIRAGTGHPQHITVGGEDNLGTGGNGNGLVDLLQRGHADRATRPVDQFNLGREEGIQAVAEKGVGLSTADLHDHPVLADKFLYLPEQSLDLGRVAVFVKMFHCQSAKPPESAGCFPGLLSPSSG